MEELSAVVEQIEGLTKQAAQPCKSVEAAHTKAMQRIKKMKEEVSRLEKIVYLEKCRVKKECDELAEALKCRNKELEEVFAHAKENQINLWNTTGDADKSKESEKVPSPKPSSVPCLLSQEALLSKSQAYEAFLGLSLEFIGPSEARVRLDNVEGCDEVLVFVLARDRGSQKYTIKSCVPRVTLLDKLVAKLNCRMSPCTSLGGFLVTVREKYRSMYGNKK